MVKNGEYIKTGFFFAPFIGFLAGVPGMIASALCGIGYQVYKEYKVEESREKKYDVNNYETVDDIYFIPVEEMEKELAEMPVAEEYVIKIRSKDEYDKWHCTYWVNNNSKMLNATNAGIYIKDFYRMIQNGNEEVEKIVISIQRDEPSRLNGVYTHESRRTFFRLRSESNKLYDPHKMYYRYGSGVII